MINGLFRWLLLPNLNPPFWTTESLACKGYWNPTVSAEGAMPVAAAPVGFAVAVRGPSRLGQGLWAFLAVPLHIASCWGCKPDHFPATCSIGALALCEGRCLCWPLSPGHAENFESLQTSHPGKEEQLRKKKLCTLSVTALNCAHCCSTVGVLAPTWG